MACTQLEHLSKKIPLETPSECSSNILSNTSLNSPRTPPSYAPRAPLQMLLERLSNSPQTPLQMLLEHSLKSPSNALSLIWLSSTRKKKKNPSRTPFRMPLEDVSNASSSIFLSASCLH